MRFETLALAIEALSWMELRRINGRLALRRTARQFEIRDGAILRHAFRLIMEVIRRRNALDHIIAMVLNEDGTENLDLGINNFLRIYASEAKYEDSTYQELVEMADLAREILGEKDLSPIEEALNLIPHLEIRWEKLPQDEAMALRTFHPNWYVRYCRELLGEEEAVRLLEAPIPPIYVRLNEMKGEVEETLRRLKEEDVKLEETSVEYVYRVLDQARPLAFLDSYRMGLFTVQDKASALAGLIAAPAAGMTVLDVCAAPGIKTGHLAEMMGGEGRIISMDFSERRLGVWKREMARLEVGNATPILGDARKLGAFPNVEADIVLVDPPCTGTGTFGRVPSGKWRITRRSIGRMAGIQKRILDNCADQVAEGGAIVYCTCSITVEENERVVEGFLGVYPEFRMVSASPRMGLPGLLGQDGAQRFYPHLHGCNGFYVARLERSMES
jgi:16S rRNA (cytosine967-C5)-methyltransferase